MSCNCKNVHQKSAQAAYNAALQTYTAEGTTINVLGTQITDTGCSITTQSGGFRINAGGLFRVSYDVTSTPGAAGAQVLQLYNGSTPMPCAVTTVVRLATCCAIQPVISARLSGAAGTVSHVCASAVKLA